MLKMRTCLVCWFICAASVLAAQTPFQKSLPVLLDSALLRCAPDGKFVYVAGTSIQNSQSRTHVMKLDPDGNLIWYRQHVSSNTDLRLNGFAAFNDGVALGLSTGNIDGPSDALVQKLDLNGNLLWGRSIGKPGQTQTVDIEHDDQGNVWVSGLNIPISSTDTTKYFLMKLDPAGNPVAGKLSRHHYFIHNGDEVYQMRNLCWNDAIQRLGLVEDFDAKYGESFIYAGPRGANSLGFVDQGLNYTEIWWDFQFKSIQSAQEYLLGSGQWGFFYEGPSIILFDAYGHDLYKIKATPRIFTPLRSYHGDILFYDPGENALTMYDTTLTPIWTRKYDKCLETSAFSGESALDGSIYTVRNINSKTVISRILPDGSQAACISFSAAPPAISDRLIPQMWNYNAILDKVLPLNAQEGQLLLVNQSGQTTDFCIRLDAEFALPDSICLGAELLPADVDSTPGFLHEWRFTNQVTDQIAPEIQLDMAGYYRIFHGLKNNFCRDTASHYVRVLEGPRLFGPDTLICGPASYSVDLTDAFATQYYLDGQATTPQFVLSQSGTYQFVAANALCRDTQTVQVKIVPFSLSFTLPDSLLCTGAEFVVPPPADFEQIRWDKQPVADSFRIRDGVTHRFTGVYRPDPVCSAEAVFQVPRKDCDADVLYVPNCFSPDGDGLNDFFEVFHIADIQVQKLLVYDRWGSRVFESSDSDPVWNGMVGGKPVGPGVYAYVLRYRNGLTGMDEVKVGDVTVLR